jgi:hypothetical protein
MPDETMAQSLGVGSSTVYRTKRRFVEGNLKRALSELVFAGQGGRQAMSRRRLSTSAESFGTSR